MTDLVRRRPIENVADKPMAVRGHSDKVYILLARKLDDLVGGFTEREDGFAGKPFCRQLAAAFFQVRSVLLHLFALRELELIKITRHPAIRDVDEEQLRAGDARERLDMSQDSLIGGTIFEWDKNVMIRDVE